MSGTAHASPGIAETVALESVIATELLASRTLRKPRRQAERAAFRELTNVLPQGRDAIFECLASLALKLCSAGTAGVSVLENSPDEGEIFRWQVLAGKLSRFVGGTTPRHWSPCGTCLDRGKPVLYSWPVRFFTYIASIDVPIPEGLVIPVYAQGHGIATIWIVSHDDAQFDAEDVRIMVSLARFAGSSLPASRFSSPEPVASRPVAGDREEVWKDYVRGIARSNQAALDCLFREARPLVFGMALRILSFAADAEEVTLDVFRRIWSSAHQYDGERGSVTAWILSIGRNMAFDRLRARAHDLAPSPEALYQECRSDSMDSESYCIMLQQRIVLQKALTAIPAEQARAIDLAFFSGMSHADITEKLGEPLGTVKTRIRMGLIRLRGVLAAVL